MANHERTLKGTGHAKKKKILIATPFFPQRQLDQQAWWIFNQKVEKHSHEASCPLAFWAPFPLTSRHVWQATARPVSAWQWLGCTPGDTVNQISPKSGWDSVEMVTLKWRLESKLCTLAGKLLRAELWKCNSERNYFYIQCYMPMLTSLWV